MLIRQSTTYRLYHSQIAFNSVPYKHHCTVISFLFLINTKGEGKKENVTLLSNFHTTLPTHLSRLCPQYDAPVNQSVRAVWNVPCWQSVIQSTRDVVKYLTYTTASYQCGCRTSYQWGQITLSRNDLRCVRQGLI